MPRGSYCSEGVDQVKTRESWLLGRGEGVRTKRARKRGGGGWEGEEGTLASRLLL